MAHAFMPHPGMLHLPAIPKWWTDTTHSVQATMHRAAAVRTDGARRATPRPPGRMSYLDSSSMDRAMHRL
ncbi:MAG: hypothetical protein ABW137_37615 [Mycobacterium sp.]